MNLNRFFTDPCEGKMFTMNQIVYFNDNIYVNQTHTELNMFTQQGKWLL